MPFRLLNQKSAFEVEPRPGCQAARDEILQKLKDNERRPWTNADYNEGYHDALESDYAMLGGTPSSKGYLKARETEPRALMTLSFTWHQYHTVRDRALNGEYDGFLGETEPISMQERYPTRDDHEDLELLKKFKLVSTDAKLDNRGYLVGRSEKTEMLGTVTRALKGMPNPSPGLVSAYETAPLSCYGIEQQFEKTFGEKNVDVTSHKELVNGKQSCKVWVTGKKGQELLAYFLGPTLLESDVPYKLTGEETRLIQSDPDMIWENVHDFIKDDAQSCKLAEIHEHEIYNPEEPGMGEEDVGTYEHIHLTDCTVPDFIRVAEAYGY